MALITCPECGKQVSSSAKTCPNCGYPIAEANNDEITIRIDPYPGPSQYITIKDHNTGATLAIIESGSAKSFHSSKPIEIDFVNLMVALTTTVKPGHKYRATWGTGWFMAKINACYEVDSLI